MLRATIYNAAVATAANSSSMSLRNVKYPGSVQFNVTDNTPGVKTFASSAVDTTADTATITAHGFNTALAGQMTTSSALPAGLSTSTTYYVIVVDANTIKFATTAAHALAGTAIDLTTQGTGNQTFTPSTLSVVCKLQVADEDVDASYTDLASATATVTGTSTAFIGWAANGAAYMRAVMTTSTGYPSVKAIISGKEGRI